MGGSTDGERVIGVQRKESIGRGGKSNMKDRERRRLKVNRGGKMNVECRVRRGISMSQCL